MADPPSVAALVRIPLLAESNVGPAHLPGKSVASGNHITRIDEGRLKRKDEPTAINKSKSRYQRDDDFSDTAQKRREWEARRDAFFAELGENDDKGETDSR